MESNFHVKLPDPSHSLTICIQILLYFGIDFKKALKASKLDLRCEIVIKCVYNCVGTTCAINGSVR